MDQTRPSGRGRMLLLGLAVAVVAIVAAGVYGIVGQKGNGEAGLCPGGAELAEAVDGAATGEVAALIIDEAPRPAPDLTFVDGTGAERRLSEWKGKTVLFNLWATWCVPCREEMPALDRLQSAMGGPDFEIVAVNIDTGDDTRPRKFLEEVKVGDLAYYADHSTGVFRELKKAGRAFGLPTTLLIDRNGCEIAHMAGPAEWDSDDARAVIKALTATGNP